MPEVNYTKIARVLGTTLSHYLGRPGDPLSIINEAAAQDVVFGRMWKRAKYDWKAGLTLKFPVKFERANIVQPMGPLTKLSARSTPAPTYGEIPMRAVGWMGYISAFEMDLNQGEKEMLRNLVKDAKSDIAVDFAGSMEDWGWARDGNYLHDGVGSNDFLKFYGPRYWCTIDGLNISGSGAVGGITPAATGTLAAWRNGFISPAAAIDGLPVCSSVIELPYLLDRAMNYMRWDNLDVWGGATSDVGDANQPQDPDGAEKPEDLMILTDKRTSLDYRRVVFDREDNVGRDQARGRPMYKRIEIIDTAKLGMNSYGYGFDDDGTALWTDRGTTYASGQWAGYGETMLINTRYFKIASHPNHAPKVKPGYAPEGMDGVAHEGNFWLQTFARSRKRGCFYIGPYSYAA